MSNESGHEFINLPEFSQDELNSLVEKAESDNYLFPNPAPYTATQDENGEVKKDYKTENLDVEITSHKHQANENLRDVDVVINQGPAIVGLEMQNENGKKLKGKKFIIEYDANGSALKTQPNLDIVQFDENTPPIAYIEYVGADGVRMILPMNGDKIKALQAQIQKGDLQFQTIENDGKSLQVDLDLIRIAALLPSEKTVEDIRKEYFSLVTEHHKLLVSKQDTKASTQKLEEYKKAHTSPPLEAEKIQQNQKVMEQTRTLSQEKFKLQATKELIRAIQNEISYGAADNQAGVSSAIAGEERARTKLQALGVKIPEIEQIEKTTITNNLSQAVKAESIERQEGVDSSKSTLLKRSSLLIGARMGVPQDSLDAAMLEKKSLSKPISPSHEVSTSSGSGLSASSTPVAAQKAAEKIAEERSKDQVMQRSLGGS